MSFKKEFKEMLGSNGQWSSKRVITFLAFILVGMAFVSNLYWGLTINEKMYDGMIDIVFVGLGVVVGEHLLKKYNGQDPTKTPDA